MNKAHIVTTLDEPGVEDYLLLIDSIRRNASGIPDYDIVALYGQFASESADRISSLGVRLQQTTNFECARHFSKYRDALFHPMGKFAKLFFVREYVQHNVNGNDTVVFLDPDVLLQRPLGDFLALCRNDMVLFGHEVQHAHYAHKPNARLGVAKKFDKGKSWGVTYISEVNTGVFMGRADRLLQLLGDFERFVRQSHYFEIIEEVPDNRKWHDQDFFRYFYRKHFRSDIGIFDLSDVFTTTKGGSRCLCLDEADSTYKTVWDAVPYAVHFAGGTKPEIPVKARPADTARREETQAADNQVETSGACGDIGNGSIMILGNGPSLSSIDLRRTSDTHTIGMNVAFRYWHRINWYPTYYICLDTVMIDTQREPIRELILNEGNGIRLFFLRRKILNHYPDLRGNPRVLFFDDYLNSSFFEGITQLTTTGSFAAIFAAMLGYRKIALLGIDLNQVEILPEARRVGGHVLEITETPSSNPNYFFADYQRKGERYNIPNSTPNLHYRSWVAVKERLCRYPVEVVNWSAISKLDIFDFASPPEAVRRRDTAAETVPHAAGGTAGRTSAGKQVKAVPVAGTVQQAIPLKRHAVYLRPECVGLAERWIGATPEDARLTLLNGGAPAEVLQRLRRTYPKIASVLSVPDVLDPGTKAGEVFIESLWGEVRLDTVVIPSVSAAAALQRRPEEKAPDRESLYRMIRLLWLGNQRRFLFYTGAEQRLVSIPWLLDAFRGVHRDQRCFIVGDGSVLTSANMARLGNEISFAVGGRGPGKGPGAPAFRYRCLLGPEDIKEFQQGIGRGSPSESTVFFPFEYIGQLECRGACPVNLRAGNGKGPLFSGTPDALGAGHSTVYLLLQIAVIMGCNPIYLIGCDVGPPVRTDRAKRPAAGAAGENRFTDQHSTPAGKNYILPLAEIVGGEFRAAYDFAAAHGVQISNAFPASATSVFPLVEFEDLFRQGAARQGSC